MIRQRQELSADFLQCASQSIIEHLENWDDFKRARTVLFFAALAGEPDIVPLAKKYLGKKQIAFPQIADSVNMQARQITSIDELMPRSLGIQEPGEGSEPVLPQNIDLVFVPALGVDTAGNRLGFGKGYYDRFLQHFSGITCAVVFDGQFMDTVPHDSHDFSMDFIATPTGVFDCHLEK